MNVLLNCADDDNDPESKEPMSAVTVCAIAPLFFHVTVAPGTTVKSLGVKTLSVMLIDLGVCAYTDTKEIVLKRSTNPRNNSIFLDIEIKIK